MTQEAERLRMTAEITRDKIYQYVEEHLPLDEKIEARMKLTERQATEREKHYNCVLNRLDQCQLLTDELHEKIANMKQEVMSKKEDGDRMVNKVTSDLSLLSEVSEQCRYLQDEAGDEQVVERGDGIPPPDALPSIEEPPSLDFPILTDEGEHLENSIQRLIEGLSVTYEKLSMFKNRKPGDLDGDSN